MCAQSERQQYLLSPTEGYARVRAALEPLSEVSVEIGEILELVEYLDGYWSGTWDYSRRDVVGRRMIHNFQVWDLAEDRLRSSVKSVRKYTGASWDVIGEQMGLTGEEAQARFQ